VTAPPSRPFSASEAYRQYLDGLLAGDRQQCRAAFQGWLDSGNELGDLYQNLVQRSLYEVGDLWQRGQISVAAEHIATAITESLLNLAYPRLFAGPRLGKSAVVACAPKERHQVGCRIVADYFELYGWRSHFLGADTPGPDIRSLIQSVHPDVVALSVTMPVNLNAVIDEVREIRAAFREMPLLVGGQALRGNARERAECLPGVRCLTSLDELEEWIRDDRRNV
jgi:methanogenic corrinoid protein MtbC1